VGLAATQINLFVSTVVASLLEQGSVSWLWYAFRLMQLPIGVFGVAIATVSLPALSRAAVDRDMDTLRGTLSVSLRLLVLLTVPAAAWLAVSSHPVIAFLYEHGRFGAPDTVRTADALVMYCIGLPAFAAVGVLTRAFYALGDTRTPVRASFVAVAVNLVLNLLLMRPLGHLGLALATSITSIVNLAQLALLLSRSVGGLDGARVARMSGRVALACVLVMAPLAVALAAAGERWHIGVLGEGIAVAVLAAVAALGLWVALRALGVSEIATVEDLVRSALDRLTGRKRA
jgi:putative peptidoglycan lipid II flippase